MCECNFSLKLVLFYTLFAFLGVLLLPELIFASIYSAWMGRRGFLPSLGRSLHWYFIERAVYYADDSTEIIELRRN